MRHFIILHSIITATIDAVRASEAGFDDFERETYVDSLKDMVYQRSRRGYLTIYQRDKLYALIETIYD